MKAKTIMEILKEQLCMMHICVHCDTCSNLSPIFMIERIYQIRISDVIRSELFDI